MKIYDARQSFIAFGQPDGSVKIGAGQSGGRLWAYSTEVIYRWKTHVGRRIPAHAVDAAVTRHAQEHGFTVRDIVRANIGEQSAPMKPHNRTSRQTRESQVYMKNLFQDME